MHRFTIPVLCLWIQDIMSVRHLGAEQLVSDKDEQVPPQIYQICAHIGYDKLLSSIKEFISGYDRRTLPLLRTTCDHCNTEYQLELREYGKENLAYMVTRWINLGPGRSTDDPQRKKVHSLGSQDVPFILVLEHMLSSARGFF